MATSPPPAQHNSRSHNRNIISPLSKNAIYKCRVIFRLQNATVKDKRLKMVRDTVILNYHDAWLLRLIAYGRPTEVDLEEAEMIGWDICQPLH